MSRIVHHPWRAALVALLFGAVLALGLITGPLAGRAKAQTAPVRRALVFNVAAVTSVDFATTTVGATQNGAVAHRCTIILTTTAAVVNLRVTSGGTTVVGALNGGVALEPGQAYTFSWGAATGYTYALRVGTNTTVGLAQIDEIRDGAL